MLKTTGVRGTLVALSILITGLGYRAALASSQNPLDDIKGGPTDYVTMIDGTSIAVTVCYPNGYDSNKEYPAILEMGGYENGSQGIEFDSAGRPHCTGRTTLGQLRDWFADKSSSNPPEPPLAGDSDAGAMGVHYHDNYFVLHASVRGTGCSAGEFDLFSQRSALDGREIIDEYIVDDTKHDWHSNGKVGIIGHSYSGLTGTLIAETQPKSLVAVSVSGLIDDVYRGITYPGGIFNGLFPPEWNLAVRPAYDVVGGTTQGILRPLSDRPEIAAQCAENLATHSRNILDDPLLHGLSQTDNEWFHARSLITRVGDIKVPFQVTGAFQDEQTGPRFEHFWERIPAGLPKRMIMTNGHHGTDVDPELIWKDRVAWLDHFMGVTDTNGFGSCPGGGFYSCISFDPFERPVSVRTLFELTNGNATDEIKDSTSFPLEDTAWTPFYVSSLDPIAGSGELSKMAPIGTDSGSASYLSGTKRQSWSFEVKGDTGVDVAPPLTTAHGPDELEFRYPFTSTTVIDGPITANLFLSTTGTDTDLFVQVIDETQGTVSILQRGLLRASHAAAMYGCDELGLVHSDCAGTDPVDSTKSFLYRPWRTHSSPQTIIPTTINEYLVEIFPVAHIFRPGHTLLVKLMAPPAVDSQYSYTPGAPGVTLNTLYFSPTQPSRVTLPVIENPGFDVKTEGPACGDYNSVRCLSE